MKRSVVRSALATVFASGTALAQSPAPPPSASPAPSAAPSSSAPESASGSPAPVIPVVPHAASDEPPHATVSPAVSSTTSLAVTTSPPSTLPALGTLQLTTLRMLVEHGVISDAEFAMALRDMAETIGGQAAESTTAVLGRWATTLYGFVEADHIFDTTQSYNDLAGNGQVAQPGTYAGDNSRLTFGVRNSRIGFRIAAPEVAHVRTSAMLEMDFLGNQPPNASEGAFFTSPTFRIRHFNIRVETPVVDFLIGQYWDLFGWQSAYHPNTVEIQGVAGQLYSRTPQIRISKTFRSRYVNLDIAAAAMRPPQRDSATPEGQFAMRLSLPRWTGAQTIGATGTQLSSASIAVSADLRRYYVAEFSSSPQRGVEAIGGGFAVDVFLPVIPARDAHHLGNSLSVLAEFSDTSGAADLYTGLNGGVANAKLPNPMMLTPAPTYTADADASLAAFTADGSLHLVQWTSFLAGLQYYTPLLDGGVWLSLNGSYMTSSNTALLGAASAVRTSAYWLNGNVFIAATAALRLGLGYSGYFDTYASGTQAVNHRVQFSAFYVF